MEWSILFMGPVGAGKTRAIHTLSDIAAADTEVEATDETALMKQFTTVSMDAGVLDLGSGDKVRLIGAPGQDRFDFMWDILLEQAKAAIVLVNHAAPHPERDLALYMRNIAERLGQRPLPLVVGVTHADRQPDRPLSIYDDCLIPPPHVPAHSRVPLLQLDARDRAQVRALVMAAVGLLEQSRTATA